MLDSLDMGSYVRESWRICTEPTVPLPCYLLRPKLAPPDPPLVLTPHGHGHPHVYVGLFDSPEEEAQIREGERDIAVQAVEQGYLVIAPTTRAFGETRSPAEMDKNAVSSCRLQLMHDLLLGRTPIGDRVWDMSRLIDWAIERQGVDPARIAITGNSGGGTVSLFAAACDTRISVAVPGCYFNTFAGSIGSIIHCDCNYVPGILRLGEMHDIAGLIAPRPFLAVAGRDDPIFPIAHTGLPSSNWQRSTGQRAWRTAASCTSATAATATTRNASGPSSPMYSTLNEHRRGNPEPLAERSHLTDIQLTPAAQDLRDDTLTADVRQIGLIQLMFIHQEPQDGNWTARELPDVFPLVGINQGT